MSYIHYFMIFFFSSRKNTFFRSIFVFFIFSFCFSLLFSFFTIHVDEKSGKGKNKFEIENISRNLWNLWGNFAIFHFCVLKVIDNLSFSLQFTKTQFFVFSFPFDRIKKNVRQQIKEQIRMF